ncbi:MAG TPA: phosphatase PAP2 family protein [Vicinamibacterales bacterium]|nr:phosphatase PAP2 family protein [Vicinamibacterales bacterium]
MHLWEAASLAVFAYIGVLGMLRGRTERGLRLLAGSAAGLLLTLVIAYAGYRPWLHDWVGPPALLLAAYWTSGALFVAPRAGQERVLMAIDRMLGVAAAVRLMPRPLVELLELGYLSIYPLIPATLIVYRLWTDDPDPARFWSVILITDYVCFAMLAWVQTRPPRALEAGEPWTSTLRGLNLRLLGTASIRVNTFPSGHAAEALATALLVSDAPLPAVLAVWGAALAVSAGAVLGRYHYAADVAAGWAVAAAVWWAV